MKEFIVWTEAHSIAWSTLVVETPEEVLFIKLAQLSSLKEKVASLLIGEVVGYTFDSEESQLICQAFLRSAVLWLRRFDTSLMDPGNVALYFWRDYKYEPAHDNPEGEKDFYTEDELHRFAWGELAPGVVPATASEEFCERLTGQISDFVRTHFFTLSDLIGPYEAELREYWEKGHW